MARNGITILREIATVRGSAINANTKTQMLAELNAELDAIYYAKAKQGTLDLAAPASPVTAQEATPAPRRGR
jgi:hypothetical protein